VTLFVSWIRHHGRSAGLAEALGAEAAFVAVGRLGDRRTAPLRYAVQAARTVALLLRKRPETLYVMAPPTLLVAIAVVYGRLFRARVVVDAHTGAVLSGDGTPRRSFARWAARASLTLVTNEPLAARLRALGVANVGTLDDPPLPWPAAGEVRDDVVFPASWWSDEPWEDVVEAARLLPDVPFRVTGRAPAGVAGTTPPNVHLTGWLTDAEYADLLAGAGVVLALTTREYTMQRAGYEALAAHRPLVASDTETLRAYFTRGAVFAGRGGAVLAEAVRTARAESARLAAEMAALHPEKVREFEAALPR
jgi:glycosyltransferase involved in cell wall biosynthesis